MPTAASQEQLNDLIRQWNGFAASLRKEHQGFAQKATKQLADLASIASALNVSRGGADGNGFEWQTKSIRVEDIPGRRVPFDVVVDIPIANASVSDVEGTYMVTQEGPFVATKRWATFQSALTYRVSLEGTNVGTFNGRTFGRFRPVHSAWDLMDAQQMPTASANPFAVNSAIAALTLPSSVSGGRSMTFDGRILMLNAGSSYPRMNYAVPSSMWTEQINTPYELGALDFFERGEVITFKVTPNHPNNPSFGNADGANIFATGGALGTGYPFLAGQFDPQEGIVTPQAFAVTQQSITRIAADPVVRLPDGILTVGLSGYRIMQPVGPVL